MVHLPESDVFFFLWVQVGLGLCSAALQSPSCPSTAAFCHLWGPVCADVLVVTAEALGLQASSQGQGPSLQQHRAPGVLQLMPLLGRMEELRAKVVRAAADLVALAIQVRVLPQVVGQLRQKVAMGGSVQCWPPCKCLLRRLACITPASVLRAVYVWHAFLLYSTVFLHARCAENAESLLLLKVLLCSTTCAMMITTTHTHTCCLSSCAHAGKELLFAHCRLTPLSSMWCWTVMALIPAAGPALSLEPWMQLRWQSTTYQALPAARHFGWHWQGVATPQCQPRLQLWLQSLLR